MYIKIILFTFILALMSFSHASLPSPILAVGTHTCTFNTAIDKCQPSGGCPAGEYYNPSACLEFATDASACNSASVSCSATPQYEQVNAAQYVFCRRADGKLSRSISTVFGCIPFRDTASIVAFALRIGLGVGGGAALLLISLSAFQIMTSLGDPKVLESAQSRLLSAISGLLFVILSAFILRILGVDILGLF